MPIQDLEYKEKEKLSPGANRLNEKQIWVPKPLHLSKCPNCGKKDSNEKTAVLEPGVKKLHCPRCGWWENDPNHPANQPKENTK